MRFLLIIYSIVLLAFAHAANAQLSLDAAKVKCVELGFKSGTEQFGKCVLELSKVEEVRKAPQPVSHSAQTNTPPECIGEVTSWHNCIGTHTYPNGNKYVGRFWSGEADGQGTLTLPSGKKYVGEFRNNDPNGQGTLTWPSGEKYVGEFMHGKAIGQGTLTFPSGEKYVGEVRYGKANGQGTMTRPSGEKYVGEFSHNMSHGQGTYTWPSGQKYVGEFRDGKRNGHGTITLPDGSVPYSGLWADDKPVE
jgi:hypothetical protein